MAGKTSYEAAIQDTFELFQDYLEGSATRPALVLSSHMLEEPARQAIEKSLAALDYGADACTYATLADSIDAKALFLLVEGLDPQVAIITDGDAAERMGHAYKATYPLDSPMRLFGRNAVAFKDLESLIQAEPGKRRAWELFKHLA